MMIKIRDDLYLAADTIVGVEISQGLNITVVVAKDGRYSMYNDYGKGAHATAQRLIDEVNAARTAVETKLDAIIDRLARWDACGVPARADASLDSILKEVPNA